MEVGEALDVEHMHLVDEQNSRHQLGQPLVDVLVHHLVDLAPQLVCLGVTGCFNGYFFFFVDLAPQLVCLGVTVV